MKTVTVAELIKVLKVQPQSWKVYLSTDPEGNSYGTIDARDTVGGSNKDKVIILYPNEMTLAEEIMPLEME